MKTLVLACLVILAASVVNAAEPLPDERVSYLQAHKQFILFRAKVDDGKVVLTFLRGPWYSDKDQALFERVRIYRRQVNFTFGKDRDEFFHGLQYGEGDVIHEGRVEVSHKRSFRWVDENVNVGATYAYWVGLPGGEPTGPVAVKVRDPRVWWSAETIAAETHKLQADFPDLVKVSVAGHTLRGREILALRAGESDKCIMLIGAVHASESGPEIILFVIRQLLTEHPDLFQHVSIAAIPCVNADERQSAVEGVPWYLRRNAMSVDLNRNFSGDWDTASFMYGSSSADPDSGTYRGPSPASEPETQAVVSFLKANPPTVAFSYHHLCSVAGRCLWAPEAAAKNDDYLRRCRQIYDAYRRGYVTADDAPDDKDYLQPKAAPGSLPTWVFQQFSVPAFDIEQDHPEALKASDTDEVTPELLLDNQQRHTAAILSVMRSLR